MGRPAFLQMSLGDDDDVDDDDGDGGCCGTVGSADIGTTLVFLDRNHVQDDDDEVAGGESGF